MGGGGGTHKSLKGLLHGDEMTTMRQDADGEDIGMVEIYMMGRQKFGNRNDVQGRCAEEERGFYGRVNEGNNIDNDGQALTSPMIWK